MKKLLKAGYVSIEVIVVAAVIIVAGLAGVVAFVKNGQGNQKKATNAMQNAVTQAESGWGATE